MKIFYVEKSAQKPSKNKRKQDTTLDSPIFIMKEIDIKDIDEVIQYKYLNTLESIEQKLLLLEENGVSSCSIDDEFALLDLGWGEKLVIFIYEELLKKFKELKVYHVVEI